MNGRAKKNGIEKPVETRQCVVSPGLYARDDGVEWEGR